MSEIEDKTLLKVGRATSVNSLAGSIVKCFQENGAVTIRAIGPMPLNQAIKAIIIANKTMCKQGKVFNFYPHYSDVTVPDMDNTVSAINLVLKSTNI